MGRDSIHDKIDELLGLLSINNNRLSLHSESLSMLDIDVLRKQCIELYEHINKLALLPRQSRNLETVSAPKVEIPVPPKVEEPQAKEEIKQTAEPPTSAPAATEIIVEQEVGKVREVEKQELQPVNDPREITKEYKEALAPSPTAKTKDKEKSHSREDAEMLSLFEKFSSKPITSIAKSISVAKRFEFQSNFFDGEAKEYNTFMSLLDGAHDREEAFAIYHAYKSKFKWDNEELKDELKALMYRKFS